MTHEDQLIPSLYRYLRPWEAEFLDSACVGQSTWWRGKRWMLKISASPLWAPFCIHIHASIYIPIFLINVRISIPSSNGQRTLSNAPESLFSQRMRVRKALLRYVFLWSDHVGIKNQPYALDHSHHQSLHHSFKFQTMIQNIKFRRNQWQRS